MFLVELYYYNNVNAGESLKLTRLVLSGVKEKAEEKATNWFYRDFNKEKKYSLLRVVVLETIS